MEFTSSFEATNRSYWSAIVGGEVISTGLHVDKLELSKSENDTDKWLFTHRMIYHHWTKEAGHDRDALQHMSK